ncbi:hypothetical protein AAK894_10490 [Lachnospiraceae bacterium 46-61]
MEKYYFYNDKLIQEIRKIIEKNNHSNKERNMIVIIENKNNNGSILTNKHIKRNVAMSLLISTFCNILYHEKADFVTLEMVAEHCKKNILYVLEEIQRQEERQ